MQNNIDLTWLYHLITAVVTGTLTWFLSRRKQTADAVSSELDNVQKAIEIYRKAAEDLRDEVKSLKKEIETLENRVDAMHAENVALKLQIADLNTHKS